MSFLNKNDYDKYNIEVPFEEMSKEQQIERRQQFLMSLADFLFATKKTIQLIMHQKIFDKVIDGVEYRFIKFRHFIRLIKRIGMSLSYNDEMCIKTLVPSLLKGWIDITKLEEVLLKIGIEDEKPAPTKHLNYSKLTGPMIRIFNKINHDMNELEFEWLEDFIGESNLDTIEIVTKNKSENIQVITPIKLREVLQEKGIINYGQDLDDEFISKLIALTTIKILYQLEMMKLFQSENSKRHLKKYHGNLKF